jgi:hypothetical protein
MWVCAPFGILMPAIRPPHTVAEGDQCTLQIRARRRAWLQVLKDQYMGSRLGEIIHTPEMDYEFRAYCRPDDFAVVLAKITLEIDFEKFKPAVYDSALSRREQDELHALYNSMWGTIFRYGQGGNRYTRSMPARHTSKKAGVIAGPWPSGPAQADAQEDLDLWFLDREYPADARQ